MQLAIDQEIWRAVNLFPNYQVSSHGRLRKTETGRIMSSKPHSSGYVMDKLTKEKKTIQKKRHQLVAEAFLENPDNKKVLDHIDCVKHNNFYQNLRWCSQHENSMNRGASKNNTSGYKGVWVCKRNPKNIRYHAYIKHNWKRIHIGSFKTAIEAAEAYDRKATELFGKFAKLNF
jgi:hypothetical protein